MFMFTRKAAKGLSTVLKDVYADWRATVAQDLREHEARSVSGITRKMRAIHTNAENALQDALDHKQEAMALLARQLDLSESHRREMVSAHTEMLSFMVSRSYTADSREEWGGWSREHDMADVDLDTLTAEQFDALPLFAQRLVTAMRNDAELRSVQSAEA